MPQRRQATDRFLATVLFTDIVGSTQHAAGLGDRAWRDLLERHNAVVRRELKAYGGREMDTAGDGFFAVFEAPERAVRCAQSITSAVSRLGMQVRAGVHMGECEVIGGKVGGMAVVIGARIAALAEAGQVLVSGSVRDLMTGSDRQFDGGEAQTLKGVSDPWRVYRLVPEELDGDTVTSRRPSMVPLYTRRQRRRLVVVVAGVLVLALAATAGYVLTRSEAEVMVGENVVGVIGAGDDPRVSRTVAVGQRPSAVADGGDSVWVTNSSDNSLSRIDRRTGVSVQVPVGVSPAGVAVGAGAVWVANSGDSTVSKIDPATSRPTNIPVGPGPTAIVVAFGSVWVTNALDASVTEIDPETNRVLNRVPVGAGPTGIAAGAGFLWVTNQGDGTVTRFDPETRVKDSPVKVGNAPTGIAVGDGAAWVANNLDGSLSRIDAVDLDVTSRRLVKGGGAFGVAANGGDVWVSNEYAGSLMRVSTRTFRLRATVRLRGAPLGLAFVGDELWFTHSGGDEALHRGGVLRIVGPGVDFPDGVDPRVLDPTLAYDPATWRLAQLSHDGLVGIRRAGGVPGIVADLATSLPEATDGGTTYTFHLRTGVRYSTGAPVLAGDIRRGIERTVVDDSGSGFYFAKAITGGRACRRAADRAVALNEPLPDCDLRKGIVADDRKGSVTFHLTKPDPEFIFQLSLPSASAVPQDTPTNLKPGEFLPATGPYMVRSYRPKRDPGGGRPTRHGRLELVRNPHFREWSAAAQPDGYPDRIVLETGYTDKAAVEQVADGRADLLWFGVPKADVKMLRTRYGSQLHTTAGPFVSYVFLNATKPPFDDPEARRAVAFALDRVALADVLEGVFSGRVSCQLLPPGFPGYRAYCPFTVGDRAAGRWAGADRAAAEELVALSGTRGAKVVLAGTPGIPALRSFWRATRLVAKLLDELGYQVSLRRLSYEDFFVFVSRPHNRFNAGVTAWGADYPTASQYLGPLLACQRHGGFFNFTGSCDVQLDRRIKAAVQQQVAEPGRAGAAWAITDRLAVDDAAYIPFSAGLQQDFVSRRVGNVLVSPLNGPLISQMWIQ